ncbi:MAG: sensor domain-containing diguanylate cyclase [Myxococcota bacterium]
MVYTNDTKPLALKQQIAVLDRRNFDLHALLKAGEALHNELEVGSLCELLMAMAHERLFIDELAVLVHDEEAGLLHVEASVGLPEQVQSLVFRAQDGILWRLLLAGEPFSIVDLSGYPRFEELFRGSGLEQLRGQTWVPMVIMGRVVGVLSLGRSRGQEALPVEELEFIGALASQAAVALSTARLYQFNAIARKELDRSLHKLSMLFNVTRAMSAVSDLTQLLRLILNQAVGSVRAQKGSLMLLDEDTDELVIRVVTGLPDKETERRINEGELACKRFARGEGVAGQVLETGESVCINRVDQDQRFARRDGSHVDSILCVPLLAESDVLGVINITNRLDGGAFEKEDEEILLALANQAAVAIARTRLYEAAITDSMTLLYVRRYIMHRGKEEFRRCRRYKTPLALVMVDIDHFKSVNDTYGHPAGDRVIQAVARVLLGQLRDVDCAGRYGGEEFMLLLPQTAAQTALVAAERLRCEIEEMEVSIEEGKPLKVTASFGIAEADLEAEEDSLEAMIKRADDALYQSKQAGRNRVTVHGSPSLVAGPTKTPKALAEPSHGPTSPDHVARSA